MPKKVREFFVLCLYMDSARPQKVLLGLVRSATPQTKQPFETFFFENHVEKPILNLLQTFKGFGKGFYKTIF